MSRRGSKVVPAGGTSSSSSSSDEDEAGPASASASSSSFVGARRVSFSAQAPQQLGVSAGALAEDRERQRLRELVASGGKAPRRKKREKLPDFPYRCDLAGIAPPCPCFAPNIGMHNGPIKGAAKPLECMHCGYARALHNAHVAPPPPRPALPAVARVKISPKAGFHAVKGDELAVTLSCATKDAMAEEVVLDEVTGFPKEVTILYTTDRSTPCGNPYADSVYVGALSLKLGTVVVRAIARCPGMADAEVASAEFTVVEHVDEDALKQKMLDAAIRARKWRRAKSGGAKVASKVRSKFQRWRRPEPRGFLLKYVYDVERYKTALTFMEENLGMELAHVEDVEGVEVTDFPNCGSAESLVVVTRLARGDDKMNENEKAQVREQDMIFEAERRGVEVHAALLAIGETNVTSWDVNRVQKELFRLTHSKALVKKGVTVTFMKPHVQDERIDLVMKRERLLNWEFVGRLEESYQAVGIQSPQEIAKKEGAKMLVQFYTDDELEAYGRRLRRKEDLEHYIGLVTAWGLDATEWFRVSKAEVRQAKHAKETKLHEAAEAAAEKVTRRIRKAAKADKAGMVAEDRAAAAMRAREKAAAIASRLARLAHQRDVAVARTQQCAAEKSRLGKAHLEGSHHEINYMRDLVAHSAVYLDAVAKRDTMGTYPPPPEVPEGGFELAPGQRPTPKEQWIPVETLVPGTNGTMEKKNYFYDPLTMVVSWSPRGGASDEDDEVF